MHFTLLSLLSFFSALFVAVQASPLNLVPKAALDVWVPHIVKPDASTVWYIGQQATVVWDTSDAPASISNAASVVLHGYGTVAQGFDLRTGSVTFVVPEVPAGLTHITLFGDSGNISPDFNIEITIVDLD
ncbi:hypothetical protein D9619_005305 [Psilocybe cf. subviscida]|uniref:Uncharacterized protein n=1 Tax=Psilocybe cf. subviscida TaxID=2480587 RepID=A0A8H5BXS8_9AGAR|nr:hypothetical protein D9619_005305 [Psilocybe cf. subviscida]